MPLKKNGSISTYRLPVVGDVQFRRNLRAKRLTITIRPHKGVVVTVPGFVPISMAKKFVEDKENWIAEKIKQLAQQTSITIITNYKTKNHELLLVPIDSNKPQVVFENGLIKIFYPSSTSTDDKSLQDLIRLTLEKTFRKEANEILPAKLKSLSNRYNLNFNSLRIKNIKSRWGSCSSNNNINLSIYLMKLPDDLIDYILIHELVHTVHKNHGPQFWSHLNDLTGNAKGLSARVKKYRTGI
jgi:predicted metal-dependent hydrolase